MHILTYKHPSYIETNTNTQNQTHTHLGQPHDIRIKGQISDEKCGALGKFPASRRLAGEGGRGQGLAARLGQEDHGCFVGEKALGGGGMSERG